ncbi:hypothetical protein AMECASPLE_010016 [Ameca splendens]|uniref:Uncharacterized protein n=1 Tax=Ameca splendens TaxID=208324 RepID=A0ABV0ZLY9_9TELE
MRQDSMSKLEEIKGTSGKILFCLIIEVCILVLRSARFVIKGRAFRVCHCIRVGPRTELIKDIHSRGRSYHKGLLSQLEVDLGEGDGGDDDGVLEGGQVSGGAKEEFRQQIREGNQRSREEIIRGKLWTGSSSELRQ